MGCISNNSCTSGFCVKGVCCNRACSNECEECLLGDGKCKAKTGACGFNNSSLSTGSCIAGKCVTCPDTSASWSIDLLVVNPARGTLTTSCGSNGGANVTFSTGAGCAVVWTPNVGAGVDCSFVDGLLSAGETVTITLAPATNKLRLGFGNFFEGVSSGKAKLVLAGTRLRQATGTEYNITTAALEIDQEGIVGVEIRGVAGSFAVTKIDSIDTTMPTTAITSTTLTATTAAATTTTVATTTVATTTAATTTTATTTATTATETETATEAETTTLVVSSAPMPKPNASLLMILLPCVVGLALRRSL
jgi:hypothetical protein